MIIGVYGSSGYEEQVARLICELAPEFEYRSINSLDRYKPLSGMYWVMTGVLPGHLDGLSTMDAVVVCVGQFEAFHLDRRWFKGVAVINPVFDIKMQIMAEVGPHIGRFGEWPDKPKKWICPEGFKS